MIVGNIAFGPKYDFNNEGKDGTWVPPKLDSRRLVVPTIGGSYTPPYIAANDNVPADHRYSWLKGLDGFAYLGTVYSKYEAGREAAAIVACRAAARLMGDGIVVYSPIVHSHTVAEVGGIDPYDWKIWQHQNQPLMDVAAALVVLTMKGWEESVGLTHEIASFVASGRPVLYLRPAELGVVE